MLELVPLLFVVFRHFDWDYLSSVTIGKSSLRKGVTGRVMAPSLP